MKIIVCMKQVPSREASLRINPEETWIKEEDIALETNESDVYALEAALQLKEKLGGEVVVCTLGPASAQTLLREALAKGAERALHLNDPAFRRLDAFGTARVLAEVLKKEAFDLVLTGLQSDDQGFAQTGVILAELLNLPHTTLVMGLEPLEGGSQMKIKRELESGWFQWLEVPLPAVLSIQSGINQPRYASLKGIMGVKKKEMKVIDLAATGLSTDDLKPKQRIQKIYAPQKTKQTEFLQGSAKEVAEKLVAKLKNDARVI
ncbi:MAG: electron transfer flavoprotein subunit beta/FixA family protein [Acidobacteriia bacterium]|nr:electron transfer flavoprotein subunit beta/FixA family protein [Terriglobia bacterium]